MTLPEFVAGQKEAIFDELNAGQLPSIGEFDEAIISELLPIAEVRMGTAVMGQSSIGFEFIFNKNSGESVVQTVTVNTPERVVFMPVPEWVVESIWQGEISGSYHFESHAKELVERLKASLEEDKNLALFEARKPVGRS